MIKPGVINQMTESDYFVLLCALWVHDAGMGVDDKLKKQELNKPEFQEKLSSFKRLYRSQDECWKDYVREKHHLFCLYIVEKYIKNKIDKHFIFWIGKIAQSHCENNIHDTTKWPKLVSIGNNQQIHPRLLAVILRLSDILHFNQHRAPDYLLEHRNIKNLVSIQHWKSLQIYADFTISDDICSFHGVTDDDESYWFSVQFINAMENELTYCKAQVLPYSDEPFNDPLSFSRVLKRIEVQNFIECKDPPKVKLQSDKILGELLNDSLYSGKPIWFRELLQNSFDACRDIKHINASLTPSVKININTEKNMIEFVDTGIGMTRNVVEDYLLTAGASYWNSPEYIGTVDYKVGHVGKFGIGFMSVFGISDDIEIVTKHYNSNKSYKYILRDPTRIIRIEESDQSNHGTKITIRVKKDTFSNIDPLDIFDNNCTFPEFPTILKIDDIVEREFDEASKPDISKSDLKLDKLEKQETKADLLKQNINRKGIHGDIYVPKIYLKTLDAFVPDTRGWLSKAGWEFKLSSSIIYGGVNYQPLITLENTIGFSHIPPIGAIRLSVSPDEYPIEMNLAREKFIEGNGTLKLFNEICNILDEVLSKDLKTELKGKKNEDHRSTIASRYSYAMMNYWLGNVPSFMEILSSNIQNHNNNLASQWKNYTQMISNELRFRVLKISGLLYNYENTTINHLSADNALIVATGCDQKGSIPPYLIEQLLKFDKNTTFIISYPDINFGMLPLRHWAREEVLIPIIENCRSVYGLRLTNANKPYSFYPRELDHLGLPVASGPSEYSAIDWRGPMGEAQVEIYSGSQIIAILNRNNHKISSLINNLRDLNHHEFKRLMGKDYNNFKDSFSLGRENKYNNNNRINLANSLNLLCHKLDLRDLKFNRNDFPIYIDDREIIAFERAKINQVAYNAYKEISQYEPDRKITLS